jgi:hypothetical protein
MSTFDVHLVLVAGVSCVLECFTAVETPLYNLRLVHFDLCRFLVQLYCPCSRAETVRITPP